MPEMENCWGWKLAQYLHSCQIDNTIYALDTSIMKVYNENPDLKKCRTWREGGSQAFFCVALQEQGVDCIYSIRDESDRFCIHPHRYDYLIKWHQCDILYPGKLIKFLGSGEKIVSTWNRENRGVASTFSFYVECRPDPYKFSDL